MAAEVVVLAVAAEGHPTSTAINVVSGGFSNVSVGHPEEKHMRNLKRTTQTATKNPQSPTIECCAVLPDLLNHENKPWRMEQRLSGVMSVVIGANISVLDIPPETKWVMKVRSYVEMGM